jgi:hypothetical protein
LTGLTSLTTIIDYLDMNERQSVVAAHNHGLRSLDWANSRMPGQLLQPDLLQQVLTSCTGLTQLTLDNLAINDQGLEVLLTHGTSITDLTLGNTSLTTSKATWACSWRRLVLHNRTLKELAYLPLKSVQQLRVIRHGLKVSLGQVDLWLNLPSDTPAAQLPDLLHQATCNLASCPAWAQAPPSKLVLWGHTQGLTDTQGVQLLQALAPVAGSHVSKLKLCCKMQLGQDEAEAIASSFVGSLTSLHLDSATLHDSFWEPLAQHFHNLQELCLGHGLMADVSSVTDSLRRLQDQVLQPDLLRTVLTSCMRLTQLQLTGVWLDDQGLEMLLTHGTSITGLELGRTSLTTSKADWACSWRELKLYGTLQEFAYLPLKSVQQLQVVRHGVYQESLVHLDLPSDTPAAQLLHLLHQATTNLACCPAWVRSPPPELLLLEQLFLDAGTQPDAMDLAESLAMFSSDPQDSLYGRIRQSRFRLESCVDAWGLEGIRLRLWPSGASLYG